MHLGKQSIEEIFRQKFSPFNSKSLRRLVRLFFLNNVSRFFYPVGLFLAEKGVHVCWKPQKDIQSHFIEVVFSNQGKSGGGPIRTHTVYQQLGIAQIFYQCSDSKSKNERDRFES